ncbi:fatty-acid amide hydrolase 1-like [Watersipora subatra]|uniref:fatty-acid amide hydrolase 1-like n=1 Tax=Watersipora subatra TaxID=2589382 RepID=UPI00355BAE12
MDSFLKDFGLDNKWYKELRDSLPTLSAAILAVLLTRKAVRYIYAYTRLQKIRNVEINRLKDAKTSWKRSVLTKITEAESERIVSMKFNDLSNSLRQGRLTALEVLRAFQRKAAVEDERFNFIAEPLDSSVAEDLARKLDSIPVSKRNNLHLFGIPVTVKESEMLAGYCSNMGVTSLLGSTAASDNPRVKVLKDFGAIPFIRTNVPQALLSYSCENPIYGRTVNPWNTSRDCGGSSGGEAAAIACGASVLGIGSDIGGSLRIPSAWTGITALKPTAGRLSAMGLLSVNSGQTCVKPTAGPMASTVDALIRAMRVFSTKEMFDKDASVPRQSFDNEELISERPLTIGLIEYDGLNSVSTACQRALKVAADVLTANGHRVISYQLRDNTMCTTRYFPKAILSDGGHRLNQLLWGDLVCSDMKMMMRILSLPPVVKKLLNFIFYRVLPEHLSASLKMAEGVESVGKWFELTQLLQDYRSKVMEDWSNEGIDAVLAPAMPVPAIPLKDAPLVKSVIAYGTPWNVLNFPSGVVPVCNVTAEDTAADASQFKAIDFMQTILKKGLKGSEGLPVGVQLISLPNCEERCLRLMKEVESAVNFKPLTAYQ